MRIQTLKIINEFVGKKENRVITNIKSLVTKLEKLSQDGNSEVREAVINLLC